MSASAMGDVIVGDDRGCMIWHISDAKRLYLYGHWASCWMVASCSMHPKSEYVHGRGRRPFAFVGAVSCTVVFGHGCG